MPDKQERAFKGIWIPAVVWLSKDLSVMEKVLLAEIDSLDNEDGCFASNDYFAEFFGVHARKIQTHLAALVKKGYVGRKAFNGRQRILESLVQVMYPSNAERGAENGTSAVPKTAGQARRKRHPYNKVDIKADNKEDNTAIADPKEPTLYKRIEKVFTDKHPTDFNFKREGTHIKKFRIICERQDDPELFAAGFLNVFYHMTKNGHDWATKGEPFMPSVMMSGRIYPRVEEEYLRKTTDDGTMAEIAQELFG